MDQTHTHIHSVHIHSRKYTYRHTHMHIHTRTHVYLGRIHGCVQVVVHERAVLVGIQHLKQCGRGVARVPTRTQLVNLIHQHQRVGHRGRLHALYELARHGADVRAPVAFDLSHVRQAAHGEPVELPTGENVAGGTSVCVCV